MNFSSMYMENINSIKDIPVEKNLLLFFDTNICIDFYQLWCNPRKFMDDKKRFEEYCSLVKFIHDNKVLWYPIMGLTEASFSFSREYKNTEKFLDMQKALLFLLSISYEDFISFCNSNELRPQCKNSDGKMNYPESNIDCLHNFMRENICEFLSHKYCCMLKLVTLLLKKESYEERISSFLDFLLGNLHYMDATSFLACVNKEDTSLKKGLIHANNIETTSVLHAAYNAAYDLYIIDQAAHSLLCGYFPVFVSYDKELSLINKQMQIIGLRDKMPLKEIPLENANNAKIVQYIYSKKDYEYRNRKELLKIQPVDIFSEIKKLEEEIKIALTY